MTCVLLIEAGPNVLPGYDASLSDYARSALEQLGVEVALGDGVTKVTAGSVVFVADASTPTRSSGQPESALRPPPRGWVLPLTEMAVSSSSPT